MTSKRDPSIPDSDARLDEQLERDKREASSDFDPVAFASRLRGRLTKDRASPGSLSPRRLSRLAGPAVLVAAAALAIVLLAWVVWLRESRTDPELFARLLARAEFFTSASLDRPSPGVAGKLPPAPERDLAWSIEALLYRAQRRSDPASRGGDTAGTILAVLAGGPPPAPVSWPRVDPDDLARRISDSRRNGVFLRAIGAFSSERGI
jgi:hypothetical protein